MAKSRRNKTSSILKNIKKTSERAVPAVGKGLTKIGSLAKGLAVKSGPMVEKGVATVYGTLVSGVDLGVKGVESVAKGVTKHKRSKRSKKSGKKTRRN